MKNSSKKGDACLRGHDNTGGVGGLTLGERVRRSLGPSASSGTLAVETGDGSEGIHPPQNAQKRKITQIFAKMS